MTTTDNLPPRLAHNQALYKDFMAKLGNPPTYPRVSRQLASVQVNPIALSPWGYNPSIIRWNDRLLMAYRWHEEHDYNTTLAIAELDGNLNVRKNTPIEIAKMVPWTSAEDPRLFLWKGELWMAYVLSNWPDKQPRCVVRYGRLKQGDPWTVEDSRQVKYGKNDGSGLEKNHVFTEIISKPEQLSCLYSCDMVLTIRGEDVLAEQHATTPCWLWGKAKGGTSLFHLPDKTPFRFFHSSLDFDPPPNRRRYYVGAYAGDGRISKRPILIGSEDDNSGAEGREKCLHWKPKVVFPGGAIEWQDGWLLACGVNDIECVLVKVKQEDLHL